MPRLPNVPATLRLRLIGLSQGVNWNAVQYATYVGTPPTSQECQTIGTAVANAWNSAIAQLCTNTVSLTQVEVTDLSDLDAAQGLASVSHLGTRIGTQPPNQVAMVASYKINVRYRGGHPRTYWPAGTTADILNGKLWTDTFRSLAQGACVDYVGDINQINHSGGPLQFVAVSYYSKFAGGSTPPYLRAEPLRFPVVTVAVHQRVDTMRSRLGKEVD